MGKQRQSKEIGGITFTVQQLGGMAGVRMLHRIGKALGPAAAAAIGGLGKLGDAARLADLDLSQIAPSIEKTVTQFFVNCTADELEGIIRTLLVACTHIDRRPEAPEATAGKELETLKVFDTLFQGESMMALQVAVFAIEVNYGAFSDVLRAAAAQYLPKKRGEESSKDSLTTS